MRSAKHVILYVLTALILLAGGALTCLQLPSVQTRIARKLIGGIEDRFDGRISIGTLSFLPVTTVVLSDVVITDDAPIDTCWFAPVNTIARIGTVAMNFTLPELMRKDGPLTIRRIEVEDAEFTLVVEGENTGYGRNNISRVMRATPGDGLSDNGDVLRVKDISARNFRFRMFSVKIGPSDQPQSIGWGDFDGILDAYARDLRISGGAVTARIPEVRVREKSGYVLNHAEANLNIRRGVVGINDIRLTDDWSDIRLGKLEMHHYNAKSFRTFTDSVRLVASIDTSRLDFRTMGAFVPSLGDWGLDLSLTGGTFDGTVFDWSLRELEATDRSGVSTIVSADVSSLKNLDEAILKVDFNHLKATTAAIDRLMQELPVSSVPAIGGYASGKSVNFRGRASGKLNDLTVRGRLSSPLGSITEDLRVKGLLDDRPIVVSGPFSTSDLDIGGIIGNETVRRCTMKAGAMVSAGGRDNLSARIDSLIIEKLEVLGYGYTNLAAAGSFDDGAFNGKVICNDPNLNFIFQGITNLSRSARNAIYKFYFNLGYADLHALNIDRRPVSKVSMAVNANYMHLGRGDLIGDITLSDISLENKDGRSDLDRISITSHSNDDIHRINFASSFLDATFLGSKPVGAMLSDLENITLKRELPSLFADPSYTWSGEDYHVSANFHDSRDLLSFILPGLYIAEGSSMKADVTAEGKVSADMESSRIAFREKYLKDLSMHLGNTSDRLQGTVRGKELSSGEMIWKNSVIDVAASRDSMDVALKFGDTREPELDRGEFTITGRIKRDDANQISLSGLFKPSFFIHNDQTWNLTPSSFSVTPERLSVHGVDFYNAGQHLRLDGDYSTFHPDTMNVSIEQLDLEKLEALLGTDIAMSGVASGKGKVVSPIGDNLGIFLDAEADSCRISGRDAGSISLGTSWNEESKQLEFSLTNVRDGSDNINATGRYSPSDRNIMARLLLSRLDISYAQAFMKDIFSELEGTMDGEFTLAGPLNNLSVFSRHATLDNVSMNLVPTGVSYTVDGAFHLNDTGLSFDDVSVLDAHGGKGVLSGGLTYDHMKDIRMDAGLSFDRLQVFDTDGSVPGAFYGNISGTGSLSLKGPLDAMRLDVRASTARSGKVFIPLNSSGIASGTNLLTFKDHTPVVSDPYEEMMNSLKEEEQKSSGGMTMHINLNVNDATDCVLEIDKMSGNSITGRGSGNIIMDVIPNQNVFNINGDYTLSGGDYHFAALGLASRDFDIQSGSTIKFEGDIMSSILDINALHTTKTSLSTLISDTTSVATRRAVECGIHIYDKLKNPQLAFSINIPDLDPSTKSMVESALNTEDKVQKQFLSLLVANSFIPDEQSGIVNNTNILYSNVASIMAGQLNNILQQLDIPLDLGLNYQSSETGTEIFDLAVSTQLFNNRVVVNGAIGNRQYTGVSGDEVVGDLDIEVKLNRSGNFRGTLFSHSVDQYTNYLDNGQRNGVGLAFQKEFNTFCEFFRSLFRKGRDEDERETGKVTIRIEE